MYGLPKNWTKSQQTDKSWGKSLTGLCVLSIFKLISKTKMEQNSFLHIHHHLYRRTESYQTCVDISKESQKCRLGFHMLDIN